MSSSLTQAIKATMAYAPKIRFIGSRAHAPAHNQSTQKPATPSSSRNTLDISRLRGISKFAYTSSSIPQTEIDIVNGGGVLSLEYLKVKPIELKKK